MGCKHSTLEGLYCLVNLLGQITFSCFKGQTEAIKNLEYVFSTLQAAILNHFYFYLLIVVALNVKGD